LASTGVVLVAAYMLWLYKRVVFGSIKNSELKKLVDVNKAELLMFVSLAFLTIFFGFYPDPLIKTINVSVDNLLTNYHSDLTYYLTEIKN